MIRLLFVTIFLLFTSVSAQAAQGCGQTATPCWTTATRPVGPGAGTFGYNTTTNLTEWYNGTNWQSSPVLLAVDFGVTADGSTSDDTAMAVALAACTNGATLILPAGTILMATTSLTIGSNCTVQGLGQTNTTISRKSTNTSTVLATITGHNIVVQGMTFDCNRGSSAIAANCVQWTTGFYDVHLRNMRATGAKTVAAGTGIGIEIQATGADAANKTRSTMEEVMADNNDANGVELRGDDGFDVTGGYYCSNGDKASQVGGGFGIDNGNPVNPTVNNVTFTGGKYCNNGSAGVGSTSFMAPVGEYITIVGVEAYGNGTYGIVADGRHMNVTGNIVHDNGLVNLGNTFAAGILANCDQCIISGNLVYSNAYFGIDAGFCSHCIVTDNYLDKNGDSVQTGGNGVWLGGAIDVVVSNNRIRLDSTTVAAQGISSNKYEPPAPLLGSGIVVKNNQIIMTTDTQWGVLFSSDAEGSIYDNEVILPAGIPDAYIQAYGISAQHVTTNGNKILDPSGTAWVTVNSGSTTVISDGGVNFKATGTAAIQTLNTSSLSSGKNTVIGVLITNHGSGVTVPGSVTVTFGACGGGTPTGTVNATNVYGIAAWAGQVMSVTMTSGGSGCNPLAPPSCSISGGGATGVTCTSVVLASNMAERVVHLWLSDSATIVTGGNIKLSNAQTFTTGGTNSMVTLIGDDAGNWHQIGGEWPSILSVSATSLTLASGSSSNTGFVVTSTPAPTGAFFGQLGTADLFFGNFENAAIASATNGATRTYLSASGGFTIGPSPDQLTATTGELGFKKIAATGVAPGAGGGKIELVCGTNSGTAKIIAYAGTSATPSTILDNIGASVTGC